MVDINHERLLTFTEAAKSLPGRPNVATLWRWRTAGCRGVKLETILVGGKRYTSRECASAVRGCDDRRGRWRRAQTANESPARRRSARRKRNWRTQESD